MLNVYKLNTEEGIEKYKSILASLNFTEPHYLPDYIDIFCNGLEDLICFAYVSETTNAIIIMPGYLKSIVIGEEETSHFDFKTPYGYTGALFSSNTTDSDIHEFWKNIDQWYLDNNVVTEFIRFNLSENYIHYSGKVFPTMLNIKGQIIGEEEQWARFDHKVRKNVNKAKRENLVSKVYYEDIEEDKILEFHEIYINTMIRTNANESFSYGFEGFKKFITNNRNHVALCTVYFEKIPVSSELILISEDSIYSFLGGTDDKYFDKRPNDFLKVEALNWARSQGKKYYVLGGGHCFEDSLFNYKKRFFLKDVVTFYTGRKILNNDIYNQLVQKANKLRIASNLKELDSNDVSFFPLYNKIN